MKKKGTDGDLLGYKSTGNQDFKCKESEKKSMKNIVLTDESYEIVVSTLINSKIEAERTNKKDINGGYIESVRKALEELKDSNL